MKRIFFILALSLVALSLLAQPTLPSQCSVYYPQILMKNKVLYATDAQRLLNSSDFGQKEVPAQRRYWVVYSDRDHNITYSEPNAASKPFDELQFNERLRIAEIRNSFALVYEEPNNMTIYPEISADAEVRGWVSMNNLLLWDVCLADKHGVYYKALICTNADVQATTRGWGYRNPTEKDVKEPLRQDDNFYFIMKHWGDMSLLAKQHTMSGGATSQVLYMWVPVDSYVPWNQRTCLEVTWEKSDVEYFYNIRREAKIYGTKECYGKQAERASLPIPCTPDHKLVADPDEQQYRMDPLELRFPILDGSQLNPADSLNDVYECSSFIDPSTKGMHDSRTLLERQKKAMEDLTHINLVLVIDGTKSMGEYYPKVNEAIQKSLAYFDNEKYDIRVGALFYRDYADGPYLREYTPLTTPNSTILSDFINKGGEYGANSSDKDLTKREALFYGINDALDRFKFVSGQSNIMLVIGDCGNADDDTSVSEQEIISKLTDKNINLISFQVVNLRDDDYNSFTRQMLSIERKTLQQRYNKLDLSDSQVKVVHDVRARVTPTGQIFENRTTNNELFFSQHKYAAVGTQIEPDELSKLMQSTIQDYAKHVQQQIDMLYNKDITIGFLEKDDEQRQKATIAINHAWLQEQLGADYDKNYYGTIAFRGWTRRYDRTTGRSYFKPVLFISSEELDELMANLEGVAKVASDVNSNNRTPYINAILALVRKMEPGLSDSQIKELELKDVMRMISGLNAASTATSRATPTLLQIASEQAVPQARYRRILNDFMKKYNKLKSIKNNEYKYVRDFNGAKYYWIPVEDIP